MAEAAERAPTAAASAESAAERLETQSTVTIEDEATKRCSACGDDRPVSTFSSAQLKKKGKRVCHACVGKKDAAAAAQQDAAITAAASARKEAMKDAFAAKLNSTPTQTATACACCGSNAAVRFAPCVRCTVQCCSLRCFDRHDCDAYLEAKRTMPTEVIPEEDRLSGEEEFRRSWKELFEYAHGIPASVAADSDNINALIHCSHWKTRLRATNDSVGDFLPVLRNRLHEFYSPRVSRPWWNPALCARLGVEPHMAALVVAAMTEWIATAVQSPSSILETCAKSVMLDEENQESKAAKLRGSFVALPSLGLQSVCFLPGRLFRKLLTLLRWVTRVMGATVVKALLGSPYDVSSDEFGILPSMSKRRSRSLAYLEFPDPVTGLQTLVPLFGPNSESTRWCALRQHLGDWAKTMVLHDGKLVLDRGLYLSAEEETIVVTAVTGWTGNSVSSFSVAPDQSWYRTDESLLRTVKDAEHPSAGTAAASEETEARKRPDDFHLVLALKQMIPEDEFPSNPGSDLFIATPQLGLESELVELSLLESLVEDAAAGNEQAQLLLTHIETECARPIADVISAQKSRLDQMLEDQAAQLRIHAEAVKRAEMRGRIRGPAGAVEDAAEGPAASAFVSSSSASALVPTSAASSAFSSSSSSSSLLAADSAVSSVFASSTVAGPAYSWTQSPEFKSVESLREPGRKKYHTITSAALRFLHSLNPVSVNRSRGSHTVFHFASGKPVTLVTPHGGDGSVSRHAATRLYQSMHDAAMEQMGGGNSGAIAGAGPRRAIKGAGGL